MGLIAAALGSAGGVLADQWREFFYCDSLDANTLMAKGQKRTDSRSSNVRGNDNIISNGSIISVNEGQCAIIVESGEIVEVVAQAGAYTYDRSTEPSILYGDLGENIKQTFANIGRRFTFGADTGKDQRVYYFNLKEIIGNKYGTQQPVPFMIIDRRFNFEYEASVRCNGEYSYKIVDPLLFYKNVAANVADTYKRDRIDSQLRTELLTALQPAFAAISAQGVRYSEVPAHTMELSMQLNEILSAKWRDLRGIEIVSFGVNSITMSEEDQQQLKDLQVQYSYASNAAMAGGALTQAQAAAMRDAANNPNGAMMGFMGLGMAQNAGGMNAAQLYQMGQQQQMQQQMQQQGYGMPQQGYGMPQQGYGMPQQGMPQQGYGAPQQGMPQQAPAAPAGSWTCECGAVNTGNFCGNCGTKKPEPAAPATWDCPTCGNQGNDGNFCGNCGAKRP